MGSIDRPVQPDPPDRPDRPDRSDRSDRSERPKTPQDFDAKLAERLSTLNRASAYERLYARAQAQDAPFRERLAREESAQPKDSLSAGKPERDLERPRTYWTEVPRFLAMWRDHAQKWPLIQGEKVDRPMESGRRAEADDAVRRLSQSEPGISEKLRDVAANNSNDGWLVGYEFRLKGHNRLMEKIAERLEGESNRKPSDIARGITDAIRYAFCFKREDYSEGYLDVKQRLEDCGYKMYLCKNLWGNREYRGVNTRWITADGQRFEVQFHTPESFHAKHEVTHRAYERARSPLTSRNELAATEKFQREVSSWIPEPVGLVKIKDHKEEVG